MSAMIPTRTRLRARLAALVRVHRPKAEIDQARTGYYAASLAAYVTATVAKAPALSSTQLDKLSVLLRGSR
jgi:hypothetical protein